MRGFTFVFPHSFWTHYSCLFCLLRDFPRLLLSINNEWISKQQVSHSLFLPLSLSQCFLGKLLLPDCVYPSSPPLFLFFTPSYQFQPCLLKGECLSIRAVSLRRLSLCSMETCGADFACMPVLGLLSESICALDQWGLWILKCRKWTNFCINTLCQCMFNGLASICSLLNEGDVYTKSLACSMNSIRHFLFQLP